MTTLTIERPPEVLDQVVDEPTPIVQPPVQPLTLFSTAHRIVDELGFSLDQSITFACWITIEVPNRAHTTNSGTLMYRLTDEEVESFLHQILDAVAADEAVSEPGSILAELESLVSLPDGAISVRIKHTKDGHCLDVQCGVGIYYTK